MPAHFAFVSTAGEVPMPERRIVRVGNPKGPPCVLLGETMLFPRIIITVVYHNLRVSSQLTVARKFSIRESTSCQVFTAFTQRSGIASKP